MQQEFSREALLIGTAGVEKLNSRHVAVFGVGGVGSYVAEAIARSGIGKIHLFDNDVVSGSNINRQLIALHSTLGRNKVDVMRERILDINPQCEVTAENLFVGKENINDIDFSQFDYVVDAIDTVTSKLLIIENCNRRQVPVISSMGTGNKLHPEMFEIADIFQTSVCPLAKVMRKELRARGIAGLKVLYSREEPLKPLSVEKLDGRRQIPGSVSFVPGAAGLIIAGEVVRDLLA